MGYSIETKAKAKKLRTRGYSIKEIAKTLNIAQSTSSLWVNDIKLGDSAQKRLKRRKVYGQYKALLTRKRKRQKVINKLNEKTVYELRKTDFNKSIFKLLCSFLFWTEGGKSTDSYVYFINSEPKMVKTFMKLMRKSFELKESKFRAMLHIHDYHNEVKIKKFWSKTTGIPCSQFSKSYNKPNTKKRIRENYKGSVRIRYYDYKIALELRSFYNVFVREHLGV